MTDIICPLCGKHNPPDLKECQYCQAPLNAPGFLPPSGESDQQPIDHTSSPLEGEEKAVPQQVEPPSSLEEAVPEWLRQTEQGFLAPSEPGPAELSPEQVSEQIDSLLSQPSAPAEKEVPPFDDEWLASLLSEVGAGEPGTPPSGELEPPQPADIVEQDLPGISPEVESEAEQALPIDHAEKPGWLTDLEKASNMKLEAPLPPSQVEEDETPAEEPGETKLPEQPSMPDWIAKPAAEEPPPAPTEDEASIAPAELPGWLEALRPADTVTPTELVEDVSTAEVVTAGPLVGLRGVISAHPSAIRARKPPTYSIKLRVTDEQRARVELMEELLADEQKPQPSASQSTIISKNIFRIVIALVLILPAAWMIIMNSRRAPSPQPGAVPGVFAFTQQIQSLPAGASVLLAFDYEAGFSGEMNIAISALVTQLVNKNAYLALVTTSPSGPALAETLIKKVNSSPSGSRAPYTNYTDLGYIPGGTMGLRGLAKSPRSVLRYSLNSENVWAAPPLNSISSIKDFNAVIVMTNDSETARAWIEQIGPQLQPAGTPLLIVTSSQAEPLIRPYYEALPSQVQGLVAGLVGGIAFARTAGSVQQDGVWDAFSVSVTISILVIIIGSAVNLVKKMLPAGKKGG